MATKRSLKHMSKRTIVNLILISIIAVIGLYLKDNPVEKIESENLTSLMPDQVDTIVIQRDDLTEIIFEKSDSIWEISSPITAEVAPEKINLLLKFLKLKSKHKHIITEPKQLIRYELKDPKISLFLNDQQFDFGNTNDFNHLRYVLHDGVVHSVKDITHHLLISDVEAFKK